MWYLIEANKRKTALLIFLMLILFAVFGAVIGMFLFQDNYLEKEYSGSLAGLCVSVICAIGVLFYAKFNASKFFLKKAGAIPLDNSLSNITVENLVEEMSIASSLGFVPKIYIINSCVPNAFSTGINKNNAAVVVTTGLLSILNREELQGVIAHEISHIKNQDTLYLMYAGVILGIIVVVSELILRSFLNSGRRRSHRYYSSRSSGKGGGGALVLLIILLITMILSPILAKLLYLSVSRKREFLADACACQYTRYPIGLASALKKISEFNYTEAESAYDALTVNQKEDSGKVISCMYIHNFLQKDNKKQFLNGLFNTHPATSDRIKILSEMARADLREYNKVYTTVVSKKDIIPKMQKNLQNIVPLAIASVNPVLNNANSVQEEKIKRAREAKNIYKVSKNYKIIKCECETILKIPPEYKKEKVICPHCKKSHNIS